MAKRKTKADKLADAMADVTPDSISKAARKTERLNLRFTADEMASIKGMAAALDMSVSEYLLTIHKHAAERLNSKRKGRK